MDNDIPNNIDGLRELDDEEKEFLYSLREAGEGVSEEEYSDFLNSYANFMLEYRLDKQFRNMCEQQSKD